MMNKKNKKGFTLIEVMTSVSIFLIVVTISMGSILGVFSASRKSRTLKTVISNLNLTIDTISREMRFGKNYHCLNQGQDTDPRDCPAGDDYISFLPQDGKQITYQLSGSTIEKKIDAGAFVPITGSEITIQNMNFYVIGSQSGDGLQPKTIIDINGYATVGGKERSDFSLQTLVSQRQLDI